MLFAFARGITRELIALLAWVLGFFAAVAFSPLVGAMLPEFGGHPVVRYLMRSWRFCWPRCSWGH